MMQKWATFFDIYSSEKARQWLISAIRLRGKRRLITTDLAHHVHKTRMPKSLKIPAQQLCAWSTNWLLSNWPGRHPEQQNSFSAHSFFRTLVT